MKRTVIIQPKRFYAFVTICILILALALTFFFSFFSKESSSAASFVEEETILVRSGDTVWHMAEPIAKRNGRDTRDVVRDIYCINNLSSSGIHPGQKLRIPLN